MRHAPLTCALLFLTLAAPAAGQTTPSAKQLSTPPADTLSPAAVPVPEIPTRAAATEARLDEIGQSLPPDRTIARVANAYAAARDTIDAVIALQKRSGQDHLTKRTLTDLHNEWIRRIDQMRAWQQDITNRTDAIAAIQTELIRRDSTWRLTRAEAKKAGAAPDVLQLVENILQRNTVLKDTVEARIVAVVRLQSQLTRTLALLQQEDDQTAEQLASLRRDLLRLDSPPLWRGLGAADSIPNFMASVRRGAAQTRGELAGFHEAYRLPIYFHLASTLGILFAVFWFRGKLDRHTAEYPAASARRILDNPAAGAWLVVTVAGLFLYPRAPLSVYDLALLAGVPALLSLLQGFLPPAMLRPAAAWAVLFAVQRLGVLLITGAPYQRVGSLLIAIVGVVILLRLLRKGAQLETLGSDGYATAVRMAARLSAATLMAAAVSNIVGNTSLAFFLTGGTVTSAYLLLVVLAAVQLFNGILIVSTRSEVARASRFVTQRKDDLVRDGVRFVRFVSALLWVVITLTVFDVMDPVWAFIRHALGASLTLGELHLSLGGALVFVTTVWVSVLVSRILSGVLEMDILSRLDMPKGLPSVIGRLTRYTFIAVGFIFALAATGLELTQLTILGGALGVGVGFGLQTVVSNFVAGLILAFERPIREGDLIQLQTLTGEVRRIGFRATVVRMFDGAEVIVPNASLIANDVINLTLSDQQRRLTIDVGVAYGTDPATVLSLLLGVPAEFPAVLKTPEPVALFTGFGDSALNFELRFWTTDPANVAILRSAVTIAVNNALVAAGIEIPFPQRDLHLRSVDAPAAAQLRGAPPDTREAT
ncbi:MAG TPA: mechanosensitive ion channel [Gemmatimonadales bacterium]|nr:mechanosensitive ion channel [Gemmatimonadales bacterium]